MLMLILEMLTDVDWNCLEVPQDDAIAMYVYVSQKCPSVICYESPYNDYTYIYIYIYKQMHNM